MRVTFIKEFAGHAVGNVINTDTVTAKFLIGKEVAEVCVPVAKTVEVAPTEVAPTDNIEVTASENYSKEYLEAVETLKTATVQDIPYPEMRRLVDAIGIKTNGATKPALAKGLNDFKTGLK